MLNWARRVEELHYYVASTYQISDTQAIDILLAALLPVPRTPAVWLIIETNWYSRCCDSAWFSFSGTWHPRSLGEIRSMRPRKANELISEWQNKSQEPRLLVEPDGEKLHHPRQISEIPLLLARSLRVRTITPRTAGVLAVDEREQQRRADNLAALTRAVIEDRVRARPEDPPVFREPPNWLYHAEMLQRLAPWYPDWSLLLNALASLAVHHAYIYGRTETTEEDWKILARVAADSVPPWIHRAVGYLAERSADGEKRALSGSWVQ